MLEQPLDKGSQWQLVHELSSNDTIINYLYQFDLTVRTDALLFLVSSSEVKETWQIAGEIIQYWDYEGERYQTAYGKVRLQEKTVIEIASLEQSVIGFKPVLWLRNWTAKVFVRPVILNNRDYLEQITVKQQIVIDEIEANINCQSAPSQELLQEIQSLKKLVSDVETRLTDRIDCLKRTCCGNGTDNKSTPSANGVFKPCSPEENIVNAYYKGFL